MLTNTYCNDGSTCLNRIRLQTCLNNRQAGSLLQPNINPVLLSDMDIVSGYQYDSSANNANACNLLIQNYCSMTGNMSGPVCQSILTDTSDPNFNGPNILSPVLANYCVGDNLNTSTCWTYCAQKNVNCDPSIQSYCDSLGSASVADNSRQLNLCACYEDNLTTTQCKQLQTMYPFANLSCDLPQCFNPQCSSAISMKPYSVKQNYGGNCPNVNQCIESVTLTNTGEIGSVNINQSAACSPIYKYTISISFSVRTFVSSVPIILAFISILTIIFVTIFIRF